MPNYPTPKQIMDKKIEFDDYIIGKISEWKNYRYSNWSKKSLNSRIENLQYLISDLFWAMRCKGLTEKNYPEVERGNHFCFSQKSKTIFIDENNPSILSTLHEIAHAAFGSDELEACAWSVQLFKECFPEAFAKLVWDGHMLVKPHE